ncbi:LOW QUALITY PROTEIN: X-box-binding protein 1 [Erpetoichthys calabaricus]|uniref:LOW QUALITY PROTEIN: X-box-binding protein 1 n=1 Tax=Erpetoichthys calabaricus TaxID=27687 RepID=UPI00109F6EA9|nr:LOW QUALITY PROTEIN: X-box-binding protein 1 [Erpetoichthys calabaricus]
MVVISSGAAGAHKVLLISGKQTVTPSQQGSFTRSVSVMLPATPQAASDSDTNGSGQPVRKRQRLTHLSPEEKALRRKLKNRVAAQTARDRKKAKMGELEQQVLELEMENQKLQIENRLLREKTHGLLTENEELRQRLGLDTLGVEEKKVEQCHGEVISLMTGSSESAAQTMCASAEGTGPDVFKTEQFHMDTDSSCSSDSESDLLFGILDILDPTILLKDATPDILEVTEPQNGETDSVPTPTSASLGSTPVKLEASNELIHFDHIYTKPLAEDASLKLGQEPAKVLKPEEATFAVKDTEEEEKEESESVCVKEEPLDEEEVQTLRVDDFLTLATQVSCNAAESYFSFLMDSASDSGIERSPSPFSDTSPSLCSDHSWDDSFANELFPQLISV